MENRGTGSILTHPNPGQSVPRAKFIQQIVLTLMMSEQYLLFNSIFLIIWKLCLIFHVKYPHILTRGRSISGYCISKHHVQLEQLLRNHFKGFNCGKTNALTRMFESLLLCNLESLTICTHADFLSDQKYIHGSIN